MAANRIPEGSMWCSRKQTFVYRETGELELMARCILSDIEHALPATQRDPDEMILAKSAHVYAQGSFSIHNPKLSAALTGPDPRLTLPTVSRKIS